MEEATLTTSHSKQQHIRVTALCIVRQGNKIFVGEGYDVERSQKTFRPIGGGVEYGERGEEAVVREMLEEAGLQIKNVRYFATCQNIFTTMGEIGHELALLYEADFVDPSIYKAESHACIEDDVMTFKALWKSLDTFGKDKDGPLYPDGLMELLRAN